MARGIAADEIQASPRPTRWSCGRRLFLAQQPGRRASQGLVWRLPTHTLEGWGIGPSVDSTLKRDEDGRRGSSNAVVGSLQGNLGGLAGTGAGSSISCRCESLVAARPSMLMLGGLNKCGYCYCSQPLQCALYPADWFVMRRRSHHTDSRPRRGACRRNAESMGCEVIRGWAD